MILQISNFSNTIVSTDKETKMLINASFSLCLSIQIACIRRPAGLSCSLRSTITVIGQSHIPVTYRPIDERYIEILVQSKFRYVGNVVLDVTIAL